MRELSEQDLQHVSGGVTRLAPQNGNSGNLPSRPTADPADSEAKQ